MLPMPAPSRQTGVSDGPLYFLSARRIPRLRAWVTFGRSGPLHRLSLCLRRPHFLQQRKGKVPRFRARVTFFGLLPPAAPFLPTAEEMGKRTPPKTNGFWISFGPILMRQKKVPRGIGHGSALAAADVVGREHWWAYRFWRLSNRALAATVGKCRCGPLGRHF